MGGIDVKKQIILAAGKKTQHLGEIKGDLGILEVLSLLIVDDAS